MKWYLEPERDQQTADTDDSCEDFVNLPTAVLHRHGARVLDPGDTVSLTGWPDPQSAIYRPTTLLIPPAVLRDHGHDINDVLRTVGLQLAPGGRAGQEGDPLFPADPVETTLDGYEQIERIPHTTALVPAEPLNGRMTPPEAVDAWKALHALRAAVPAEPGIPGPDGRPTLSREIVEQIGLEHLLSGQALMTGVPVTDGGGIAGGQIGGVTGPTTTDSYLYNGGDSRVPVDVCLPAPGREWTPARISTYGRRPVVAVIDTGVRAHPWLDVDVAAGGGYSVTGPDAFVQIDRYIQDDIYRMGQLARQSGDRTRRLIEGPWDRPAAAAPLVGELDTHTGHGTFIAGLVRQITPDATVLSIRVMHSDGIAYEGDLIRALHHVVTRVGRALSGNMDDMVDVVSLSLGYFGEHSPSQVATSGLGRVIGILRELGVAVTSAAGNYSASRWFYPAALATQGTPAVAPMLSVGALNPNGSKAIFSNGGDWINAWAPGACLMSAFPVDINCSREPELSMKSHPANPVPAGGAFPDRRDSLDPDNFSCGFALWSGTSFSAPVMAALLAGKLLAGADRGPALRLDRPGQTSALTRIHDAMDALRRASQQNLAAVPAVVKWVREVIPDLV